jgi:membrane protease YdiL (CAAX protease family)
LNDEAARRQTLVRVLVSTLATTAVVTLCSYLLPERHQATGVGLSFLVATYLLVLRRDDGERVRHHGLALGGLLESEPLDMRRMLRDFAQALAWALAVSALVFPAFWLGYRFWHTPGDGFSPPPLLDTGDAVLGEVMVIALPEEAFYRGYLLTALDDLWPPKRRVLGASVGLGLLVSSAVFALGHLLTEFNPNRLAVFFPALVFGWLRARTSGIGAPLLFHAFCNLFASYLARGYGFAS